MIRSYTIDNYLRKKLINNTRWRLSITFVNMVCHAHIRGFKVCLDYVWKVHNVYVMAPTQHTGPWFHDSVYMCIWLTLKHGSKHWHSGSIDVCDVSYDRQCKGVGTW